MNIAVPPAISAKINKIVPHVILYHLPLVFPSCMALFPLTSNNHFLKQTYNVRKLSAYHSILLYVQMLLILSFCLTTFETFFLFSTTIVLFSTAVVLFSTTVVLVDASQGLSKFRLFYLCRLFYNTVCISL